MRRLAIVAAALLGAGQAYAQSTTAELKAALDQAMRTIQDLQARVKALEEKEKAAQAPTAAPTPVGATPVVSAPGAAAEPNAPDPGKAREVLGFVAERKLADGLAETVAWYRENRAWWERLRWMRSVPVTGADGTVTHW